MLARIRRFLAPALAAAATGGCNRATSVPMTILALDSTRVAGVAGEAQRLSVYSVEQRRSLWDTPTRQGAMLMAAAFSPDGTRLATFEKDTQSSSGRLSVRDASTGQTVSGPIDIQRDPDSLNPSKVLAVSNGARFVASSVQTTGLRLDDLQTGASFRDRYGLREASFSEDGEKLAATLQRNAGDFVVRVFGLDGGAHQIAEFDKAWTHAWVGNKLAVNQEQGVSLWNGKEVHQLAPRTARIAAKVRLVASGKWLAVFEQGETWQDYPSLRLAVYDAEAERLVFEKTGLGAPLSLGVNATRLVGAFERGESWETFLIQLEIPSGKIVSEKSLGARSRRQQSAPFTYTGPGEGSDVVRFVPTVLPGGRYLDVSDGEDRHDFRAIPP